MKAHFEKHIREHFPFLFKSKILLAVSGGLDSTVLTHLCHNLGLDIGIAHCNFMLRGEESDGDEAFVREYASGHNIPFYVKRFDTSAPACRTGRFAKANKTSTQITARNLRYEWFDHLLDAEGYDYLLTAHHANDSLETMLINMGRGTGIDGLTGIPEVNGKTVRVLLPFSRKRIKDYATSHNIAWREDRSNASDDYLRNHLRHHAIPALEDGISNFLQGASKTQEHLKQAQQLLSVYTQELKVKFTQPYLLNNVTAGVSIDIKGIQSHPAPEAVLYALLNMYGFTAWDDISALMDGQTGKQVFSATHRLLKDRTRLLLLPIQEESTEAYFLWEENEAQQELPSGVLHKEITKSDEVAGRNSIIVDESLLHFPLTVRRWKEGDSFQPFGMDGRKKLSKYFKDEKLSLIEKEKIWLLCAGDDIVWIINQRADDRFKITKNTTQRLLITYNDTTH
ncbi:tRNA lysidine(34) synthetase TilS [Dokdonia sinensis]|uniref:tRNA(Ile)-lysidine synthase n=1 Tax=Dokdonia sinensis TaxID=2479847 RepID=A0A3M0GHV1_9FLAO|nr:tRNA lysidine(34) synthetase TilS [Dokdonia sinensis]RMB56916.1 tRNA lysidine(34) synthetase TilS [Dokdonia sinensis]